MGLPPSLATQPRVAARVTVVDLSGKPKVWFVIGPGRSGKTMLLRWVAEMTANQGSSAIVAAADPQNRSLKNYLEGVAEPPTNDAVATSRWLEALLRHVMDEKASAMVDLGGGDTALHKLLTAVPDLAVALDGAGVDPWRSIPWGHGSMTLLPWPRSRRWGSSPRPRCSCAMKGLQTG